MIDATKSFTDDEFQRLLDLKDEFWHEFSKLCHSFLERVPEDHREHLKLLLGESTSIYGIANKQSGTGKGVAP